MGVSGLIGFVLSRFGVFQVLEACNINVWFDGGEAVGEGFVGPLGQ